MSKTLPFAREIAASTAVDFATTLDNGFPRLPQAIEMPDGGTLVFTDGANTERTFADLPAGWRAAMEIRAISASTTAKCRVYSSAAAAQVTSVPTSIGPSQLAGIATDPDGFAPMMVLSKVFTAGTTGSADDVTVLEDAPFAFKILDSYVIVDDAKTSETVTLRSATGGGGSALSSAMSVNATGRVQDASTSIPSVAVAGNIYLRRSDRDCGGVVVLLCAKS